MLEILKGQVSVVRQLMQENRMNTYVKGTASAIDRNTEKIVFMDTAINCKSKDFPVADLSDGELFEGGYELPEDNMCHLNLYRTYPSIKSIVHVYPKWVMIFSEAGKEVRIPEKLYGYGLAGEISCISGFEELRNMGADTISESGALILKNQGAIVWAQTPYKAMELAIRVERIAELAWRATLISDNTISSKINPVNPIPHDEDYSKEDLSVCKPSGSVVTESDQKRINLALLIYFDKVCRENNIKYSITGGTLLGAVRHGGFIPWDDDVDVFLTRPEYEKLREVFPENERFEFTDMRKNKMHNFSYGRLADTKTMITESPNTCNAGTGLFLDISIVDGLPNNALLRKIHIEYMWILFRLRRSVIHDPTEKRYTEKGPLVSCIKYIMRRLTTIHFWNRRMDKAMKRYSFEKSQYIGNFTQQYAKREMLRKSVFDSYIDMEFEGYKFMVCQGYEEYLKNIYRDYMKLPRKDRRKGHHVYTAYWI